jgi:ketosteroid isomerase-like protein
MKQRYYSDLLKSEGIKRLYVRDKGEALEIVGEQWNPLRGGYVATSEKPEVETPSFVPADETRVEEERIKTFIERWRGLWERKDLDAYMRCYSEDFKTQGMDTRGWKKLKRFLMNKYKNIKVIITGAEIKVREGGEAEVSFSQRYQTECYSDEGAKTLHLKKEKGEWKIVSEQWRPL